jgi:hypothetical protein
VSHCCCCCCCCCVQRLMFLIHRELMSLAERRQHFRSKQRKRQKASKRHQSLFWWTGESAVDVTTELNKSTTNGSTNPRAHRSLKQPQRHTERPQQQSPRTQPFRSRLGTVAEETRSYRQDLCHCCCFKQLSVAAS